MLHYLQLLIKWMITMIVTDSGMNNLKDLVIEEIKQQIMSKLSLSVQTNETYTRGLITINLEYDGQVLVSNTIDSVDIGSMMEHR